MTNEPLEKSKFLLATLVPSAGQRRLAIAIVTLLTMAFVLTAPFARTPLPHVEAFIPATQGVIFANDLITAVLLFAQFSISGAIGILALASGYFFVAMIVIPHSLTFPGAFTPSGLLGAGPQTTAWLYNFWHIGFPLCVLVYVSLKDSNKQLDKALRRFAIMLSIVSVVLLVIGLTWLTTAGAEFLPRFFAESNARTPVVYYLGALDIALGSIALILLWLRRRSILDLWLMVAMVALILEVALVAELTADRFRLGFYAGRIYTLATSITVLVALISEAIRLDARLADSNLMLQRERDNRLISVAAVAGAISHEVRQPLMAITMNSGAALRYLAQTPPDHDEIKVALDDIVRDSHRASHVFESVGSLFRGDGRSQEVVDLNEITRDVIQILKSDVAQREVTLIAELAVGLPTLHGHKGQLQEVIINLIKNAVEAMRQTETVGRTVLVRTARHSHDEISLEVEDSGTGIGMDEMAGIFDAFVTSKSQGMGLGLAICRTIIERHGGQLSASPSKNLGGALFTCVLPISQTPRAFSLDR